MGQGLRSNSLAIQESSGCAVRLPCPGAGFAPAWPGVGRLRTGPGKQIHFARAGWLHTAIFSP